MISPALLLTLSRHTFQGLFCHFLKATLFRGVVACSDYGESCCLLISKEKEVEAEDDRDESQTIWHVTSKPLIITVLVTTQQLLPFTYMCVCRTRTISHHVPTTFRKEYFCTTLPFFSSYCYLDVHPELKYTLFRKACHQSPLVINYQLEKQNRKQEGKLFFLKICFCSHSTSVFQRTVRVRLLLRYVDKFSFSFQVF